MFFLIKELEILIEEVLEEVCTLVRVFDVLLILYVAGLAVATMFQAVTMCLVVTICVCLVQ